MHNWNRKYLRRWSLKRVDTDRRRRPTYPISLGSGELKIYECWKQIYSCCIEILKLGENVDSKHQYGVKCFPAIPLISKLKIINIALLTHFCVAATAKGDLFPIGKWILWGIYEIPENPKNLDTQKIEWTEIQNFTVQKWRWKGKKCRPWLKAQHASSG